MTLSHRLTAKEVQKLLVRPACPESFLHDEEWNRIEDFPVMSKGAKLSAEIYLPREKAQGLQLYWRLAVLTRQPSS